MKDELKRLETGSGKVELPKGKHEEKIIRVEEDRPPPLLTFELMSCKANI